MHEACGIDECPFVEDGRCQLKDDDFKRMKKEAEKLGIPAKPCPVPSLTYDTDAMRDFVSRVFRVKTNFFEGG